MSAPRTAGTHGRADWAGVLCKGLGQGWGLGWLGWLGCCRSYLGWIVMVIITSSQRQHDRAPPSSSSIHYPILPLCFSSTHTRQSANNAYLNNTQQQRRVSYITWGKLSSLSERAYQFLHFVHQFQPKFVIYFGISVKQCWMHSKR